MAAKRVGDASWRREVGAAGPDPQRRRAALEAARLRYGGLSATGRKKLLDELELLTGYHRKSLLRLLNRRPPPTPDGVGAMEEPSELKPHPRRRYGPEAAAALVPLWEASDRLCGKRLAALLPLLVESLEQHGHLVLEPAVREQVLAMSSATIDRLLAPIRKASGGNNWRRPPRAYSGVRRRVPVRTFKGWDDHHEPGSGPTESQAQGSWRGHAGAGFVGTALVPWPSPLPMLI